LAQARDRSIVISGDTAPSQNLVKLAAGADVLVHSVLFPIADALPPAALRISDDALGAWSVTREIHNDGNDVGGCSRALH